MEIIATITSRSGSLTVQKIRKTAQRSLSTEIHLKAPCRLIWPGFDRPEDCSLVILDPNAIREGK